MMCVENEHPEIITISEESGGFSYDVFGYEDMAFM
jgi:hypothetical protein